MEKVITNENGAFLEVTEEQSRLITLDELKREKEMYEMSMTNMQNSLNVVNARIEVLEPKVNEFKAQKSEVQESVES